MKINLLLLAALVGAGSVSFGAERTLSRGVLSALGKEKMTHTISPVYHEGTIYGFYQAGETHTVENVADPTELMRLGILRWNGSSEVRAFVDVGVSGQDFGSFVQTTNCPPCAQTAIGKDGLVYLFFRGRRADGSSLWCYRIFDTRAGRLTDGATICTLDGREFNGGTARDSYNRVSGDRQKGRGLSNECNIRLFSDGWYYMSACVGGGAVGLVVRTRNLKDWESVMATPDLRRGATWEHELAELAPGKWIAAWRQERLGEVWTAVCDVSARKWSVPQRVPESIAVKPCLFAYRGKMYLATNLKGPVTTPGYGTAVRATLGVFEVAADGKLSLVRKIVNPTGCHYVSTIEDGAGNLYLCHSTDERKLDVTQCRSNIAFFRFDPTAPVSVSQDKAVPFDAKEHCRSWHGFNLLGMFCMTKKSAGDPRIAGRFPEDRFQWMREWGFNFARLPLDYRFLVEPGDWMKPDEAQLQKLDEAVRYGKRYGVHVQINFHRAPGFCCNKPMEPKSLFRDPEPLAAFTNLWSVLAKRYRGIPNEELSFDLVNEPAPVEGYGATPSNYAVVARAALAAIRAVDPGRFVMSDGWSWGNAPTMELHPFEPMVGESIHCYTPHSVTHYRVFNPKDTKPCPPWPPAGCTDGLAWLDQNYLKAWRPAIADGTTLFVGEFGCHQRNVPHATYLAWLEDVLKMCKRHGWGWALWNLDGTFGILDTPRTDCTFEDFHGHRLDRKALDLLLKYR